MVIQKAPDVRWSEITPKSWYLRRREFLRLAGITVSAAAAGWPREAAGQGYGRPALAYKKGPFATDEPLTPHKDVTSYNNFYEFGTGKADPARYSGKFQTKPSL